MWVLHEQLRPRYSPVRITIEFLPFEGRQQRGGLRHLSQGVEDFCPGIPAAASLRAEDVPAGHETAPPMSSSAREVAAGEAQVRNGRPAGWSVRG
jgi:hypothetical protein